MRESRKLYPLLILVTIALCSVAAGSNFFIRKATSQDNRPKTSLRAEPEPALEGRVFGVMDSTLVSDDRKTVLAHPAPNVHLVFDVPEAHKGSTAGCKGDDCTVSVFLPAAARRELTSIWTAMLGYLYRSKIEGIPDAKTQINEDREMLTMIIRTEGELQKLTISTPGGRRLLSKGEAESLVRFYRVSAEDLIDKVIQYKKSQMDRKNSSGT